MMSLRGTQQDLPALSSPLPYKRKDGVPRGHTAGSGQSQEHPDFFLRRTGMSYSLDHLAVSHEVTQRGLQRGDRSREVSIWASQHVLGAIFSGILESHRSLQMRPQERPRSH